MELCSNNVPVVKATGHCERDGLCKKDPIETHCSCRVSEIKGLPAAGKYLQAPESDALEGIVTDVYLSRWYLQ